MGCLLQRSSVSIGSVTQHGDKMKDIHCSPKQRMMIHKAHYGDFINGGIFDGSTTIDKSCSRQESCEVKSLCGGNRSCELTVDNTLLPSTYCSDTTKELYIEYTCVDNYTNPITTGMMRYYRKLLRPVWLLSTWAFFVSIK